MTISLAWLRRRGACKPAREQFESVFGKREVAVTPKNLKTAEERGLYLAWVLHRLVPLRVSVGSCIACDAEQRVGAVRAMILRIARKRDAAKRAKARAK